MARGMKIIAWVSLILTLFLIIIYQIKPIDAILTLAVTAGTTAYHFWMRLLVGGAFNLLMNNRVDYNKKWFCVGKTEQKLYALLKVKKWKKHLPTYNPSLFDRHEHSLDEIAMATCQSELVHETIVILSFLPILASFWFGEAPAFVCTSVLSAVFDFSFVMIQRYNRPRILNIIK